MADALDSKSSEGNLVWVRLPPSVLDTGQWLTLLACVVFRPGLVPRPAIHRIRDRTTLAR